MRKTILFCLLLLSLVSRSQEVLVSGKDTLICFTPDQSKFILKQVTELEFCKDQNKINENILLKQDSLLNNLNETIAYKDSLIENCDEVVHVKDIQITVLRSDLDKANRAYTKQKRRTKASLIGGSILSGILTVLIFVF